MFGISEFSRSPYGQALGAGRRLILIRFAPNPDYDIESMGSRSILLDIKCINDEICRDLTGVSNQKELEFARYLSENGKHMWIRQVLVPGYTDKEDDLIKLKEFLATLKTVDKVEILPYHDMGRFKWEQLGLEYPLDGVRVANNEDVERAKKLLGI